MVERAKVGRALAPVLLGFLTMHGAAEAQTTAAPFHLIDATIPGIHAALASHQITCVALVKDYLARIAAYDQQGPTLNAIQSINDQALKQAAAFDAKPGTGPLACIPVVVKEEINTNFLPTTYGSALFKGFTPERNATSVDRLLAAGAIILAKTNMGEYASAYSGSAFGDCHNAYDPRRSPSGSSCGSAIAVTANFAAAAIGEDTGGSIRGPAAHANVVGLRPTLPLVSRAGMMPFAPTRDTLGPITRTVRDAAIMLDVLAGYDPADPVTAESYGKVPKSYTAFLKRDGLKGMRFGVIRQTMEKADRSGPDYKETQAAVDRAIAAIKSRGGVIVDAIEVPRFAELFDKATGGDTYEPEGAINTFLAEQRNPPAHNVSEIVASPLIGAKARADLTKTIGHTTEEQAYLLEQQGRDQLRINILKLMADLKLDALIHPTYDLAPAVVPASTTGSNRRLAAMLAWPAIAVPGGFFSDGLPIGIEFLGRAYSEGTLLRAAFDFEQTTKYRRPPATVPKLAGEP